MTEAIILAGGLGTRLREVVADLPKPMAPVRGEPFLAHLMRYWKGQGVTHFVLSISYLREKIIEAFGDSFEGIPITYAIEDTPLGTGGGLLISVAQLKTEAPFLLLNGDTYFDVKLGELSAFHTEKKSDWTFSLFKPEEAGRYLSIPLDADGKILDLKPETKEAGGYANGGVYMINPQILAPCGYQEGDKLSLEDDLLPVLQRQNRLFYGRLHKGTFIDIGIPHDYSRADSVLA
ncbi:MAG: nucleotidyltransferase family protein [Alphaproteobacteria bacterium]|jgi:D-glycero-alpha-D-manno-heptose 1-phosphate guanylyltransferase|nr:nucleotidyltransferase family protein [Alphaproteobacteria bacterium]